jgi:hypothetical protein
VPVLSRVCLSVRIHVRCAIRIGFPLQSRFAPYSLGYFGLIAAAGVGFVSWIDAGVGC